MKSYYAENIETVASKFNTDLSDGLTEQEAKKRLRVHGFNLLKKKKLKSKWRILYEQFTSPIVWILIVVGVLAFIFEEIPEGVAIVIVIAINAGIGYFMELQAVRSMNELLKLGRAKTKVIREGILREIDSAMLVPGDLVYLEAGDLVTADARLTEQNNLAIKEAALTGESEQVTKQTDVLAENTVLADRNNSIYKGTMITRGNGKAIVVYTGDRSELGKISEMAQETEKDKTPLDKRLNELGKRLIWLTLAITLLIFISGVLRGRDLLLMIETAIALAVAAIPEGLPVIATITLARGMMKLSKKNAIVKTLEAVQTLGEIDVIFTDKTGTLTENEMYLDRLVLASGSFALSDFHSGKFHVEQFSNTGLDLLLKTGVLCNDSYYNNTNDEEISTGDPIEVALLRGRQEIFKDMENVRNHHPRITELPFSADAKMMGTMHRFNGEYITCAKGAIEALILRCTGMLDQDGKEVPIQNQEEWLDRTNELGSKGYRVLSFAYKRSKDIPDLNDFIHDLTLIGLACFVDPARPDVHEAVLSCKDAGIKVVMVTGDHPETAGNIAERVGIVENNEKAIKIHGSELAENFEQNQGLLQAIKQASVFARTNPAQKLDLVELFQESNHIVGMTGDGVNDAPALKKADIGIAMGQRGTEAAKEVADIVLKDDSFSTIVLAIRQGRIIFNNIRMFVVYLLSCNLSEILVVGTASFLGIPLPLLPLQILYLNMITDVFPALALGMNEGEGDVMNKPPRRRNEPIITKELWFAMFIYGISMTIAVLCVEFIGLYYLSLSDVIINNMTFYTLILVQLWNVFNLPGASTSIFKNEVTKNKFVWLAIAVTILIVIITKHIGPVSNALGLTTLEPIHWVIVILFSFIPVILIQLLKRFLRVIK